MFEMHSLMSFFMLAVVATLSPGPAVLLAISNGANFGLKTALIGILGNIVSMLLYASVASLGMGVVISQGGELILRVVQISGGIYLIFLGLKSVIILKKISYKPTVAHDNGSVFGKAMFVGLSNPKAMIFFSALFPQFVSDPNNLILQSLVLSLIFASCSFSALTIYAFLSSKFLGNKNTFWFSIVNKFSGFIFILFGGGLIYGSIRD